MKRKLQLVDYAHHKYSAPLRPKDARLPEGSYQLEDLWTGAVLGTVSSINGGNESREGTLEEHGNWALKLTTIESDTAGAAL